MCATDCQYSSEIINLLSLKRRRWNIALCFYDTVKPQVGQIILQLPIFITVQKELNLYFRSVVGLFFSQQFSKNLSVIKFENKPAFQNTAHAFSIPLATQSVDRSLFNTSSSLKASGKKIRFGKTTESSHYTVWKLKCP